MLEPTKPATATDVIARLKYAASMFKSFGGDGALELDAIRIIEELQADKRRLQHAIDLMRADAKKAPPG